MEQAEGDVDLRAAAGRVIRVGWRASQAGGYELIVEPANNTFALQPTGSRFMSLEGTDLTNAIARHTATNRIELICTSSTITASINGSRVALVQDTTHKSGSFWIGAGSAITVEARFDNLTVFKR